MSACDKLQLSLLTLLLPFQAFSHWTYEATERLLLVADVQGVKDHEKRQVCVSLLRAQAMFHNG
jgi:hypothetical protein